MPVEEATMGRSAAAVLAGWRASWPELAAPARVALGALCYLLIIWAFATAFKGQLPLAAIEGGSRASWIDRPALYKWDSPGWDEIVLEGYHHDEVHGSNAVRPPLFPWLAWSLSKLTGLELPVAGFGLSWLSFVFAMVGLRRYLCRAGLTESELQVGLLAVLAFPTAFIFAAYYTESLFFCLSLAAFNWARAGRCWLAALMACTATLCRLNGVFLAAPLFLIAVEGWRSGGRSLRLLLPTAGCGLGAGILCGLFAYLLGDPLAMLTGQSYSGRHLRSPLAGLTDSLENLARMWGEHGMIFIPYVLELLALVLLVLSCLWLARARLWPEASYVLCNTLAIGLSGRLIGLSRFTLVLFPLYFLYARVLAPRPTLTRCLLIASLLSQAFLLIWFVQGLPPPP